MELMIKIPVILVLLFIIGSLAQAMYYLAKDSGDADKIHLVRALTVRISLSFLLFGLLILAYVAGWITPATSIF